MPTPHAQLVFEPGHADMYPPGHHRRIRRIKYVEPVEILLEWRASNAKVGRITCPACDWMEEHLDWPVIKVERALYAHPEWGPSVLCEVIRNTIWFNNADSHEHGELIAAAVQHDAALALIEYHPFERARGPVEDLMQHHATRFVSPDALFCIVAYINGGHPNPRRFLELEKVRDKLPSDLDLSRFAAPDFDRQAA